MRPISLNHSHRLVKIGNRASRIKTNEAKNFEKEFAAHLAQYNDLRSHLLQSYNENRHCLEMECFFYLNYKEFFTAPKKSGKTISKKSLDLDNIIKAASDQVYNWLGIDDSQVVRIIAEKVPTNHQATMVFRISLIQHPELFVVLPFESATA